jgi:hypothetical protein
MSGRGWGGSVAIAVAVAALAGAAQLGLGSGLGIVAWQPVNSAATDAIWLNSLTWTFWIAATSVIAGAIVADRLSRGTIGGAPSRATTMDGDPIPASRWLNMAWRCALAAAATVGAAVTIPLISIPARHATRTDEAFAPDAVAGGNAVVGLLLGLIIAAFALASRAVANNVITSTLWVWALAAVAVTDAVGSGLGLHNAQLAVWRFNQHVQLARGAYDVPTGLLTLGAALVIGLLAAWPAGRRGDGPVGVVISGAVGPALVAVAYLFAGPALTRVRVDQASPSLIAPYAVIAGLAGSVLIGTITFSRSHSRGAPATTAAAPDRLAPGASASALAASGPRAGDRVGGDTAPPAAQPDVSRLVTAAPRQRRRSRSRD